MKYMDESTKLVLQLLIGLLTAGLTSYLTVKFSLGRYYAEKWWERKYEAYKRLIDTMYEIRELSVHLSVILQRKTAATSDVDNTAPFKKAIDQLLKDARTAEFLVSDEAAYNLSRLVEEIENAFPKDTINFLSTVGVEVHFALPKIIKCAR